MKQSEALLRGVKLNKSFGSTSALRDANITIGEGELVAIMGPSGSGKSTLLHCLAGIAEPDSGEVWFDGRRLDSLDDETKTKLRRTDFGFIFQFGQLVPELTAIDNVALPLLLNNVPRKQAYQEAGKWLQRLDVANVRDQQIGTLSGGQSQRIAIARALVIKPKVIFADEPTGSLDSLNSEHVMELLVDIAREDGVTLVVITHDARVAAYCEREIMVRDGMVTETASAKAKVVQV
jgi:putative ABC transport system ATP-binding protein